MRSQNIRETWWFTLICTVLPFFLGIGFYHFILPPPQEKPHIEVIYQFIKTVPFNPDPKGRLRLDYETDRDISGVQFFMTNDGGKEANNLEIDIVLKNEKIIVEESTIVFDPCRLEDRLIASSGDRSSFYRKLRTFPCNGRIYIMISSSSPICEEDIDFDFLSEGQVWQPKAGEIDLKKAASKRSAMEEDTSLAFAQPGDEQKPQPERKLSSGISVGGYDPLVLGNNTFVLIQKKNLISPAEAKLAKDEIATYKKGVLFGGINPLKLNEVLLNALVRNKRISSSDAEMCVAKSRESGGVLISGHNVVVLNVEILKKLLQNGWISKGEAQKAIDDAKVTWRDTPDVKWMDTPDTKWMNR